MSDHVIIISPVNFSFSHHQQSAQSPIVFKDIYYLLTQNRTQPDVWAISLAMSDKVQNAFRSRFCEISWADVIMLMVCFTFECVLFHHQADCGNGGDKEAKGAGW